MKPTSSIYSEQKTVDINGDAVNFAIRGRHDPCILPRVIPVIEAMTAIDLLDLYLIDNSKKNMFEHIIEQGVAHFQETSKSSFSYTPESPEKGGNLCEKRSHSSPGEGLPEGIVHMYDERGNSELGTQSSRFAETSQVKDIIKYLFNNPEIQQKFVNEIRRSTIIGQLTNEILQKLGSTENCKILAIGDVKYFGELEEKWQGLVKNSLSALNVGNVSGYDMTGQGSAKLRDTLYNYMRLYYDFSKIDRRLTDEIIPTYGGTDGFVSVLDVLKNISSDKKIRFIYPESSFMANIKIAENILGTDSLVKINKPSPDNFFITPKDISNIPVGEDTLNIYYITPVGNPTGEKIDSENLYDVLNTIATQDKNAVLILDNVYVGLLRNDESTEMFKKIFENENILNKIIFLESLSKTLGTTGIRIGWTWTTNSVLSENIKKSVILKKAGFSKILDEFTLNLLSDLKSIETFQNQVYDFWSAQRLKFVGYIKDNFPHLFDFEKSPEILDRQGIYVLLKVKDNLNTQDIFAETGIIGVGITLSDGDYIRYAFGNVKYF